jgi:two-component system, OmpR family, sensor kinase
MAKSLRNRILIWHIASLTVVAVLLSGSFYFGLQQSRNREIDFEMEGAGQSLISLLRALPAFEMRSEKEGVPHEVLMRRRELERQRQRRLRENPNADASDVWDEEMEEDPPFGLPRGPERILRSMKLPAAFVERHRRREGVMPYFVILRGDSTRMAASSNAPDSLSRPTQTRFDIPPMSFRTRVPVKQEGSWREMWLDGPEGSQVIVGRSTTAEDGEMQRWLLTLGLLNLGVLAFSSLTAWWISRKVVSSLKRISQEASQLSLDKLDHQIDVGKADVELKGLVETLNNTYQQLAEAFQRQRQFTADASHELRTPLTIILGNLELALLNEKLDVADRESLDAAQRAAKRMKSLMEHLLMLARADARKLALQKERCDLAALVEECYELLEPLGRDKNLTWHIDLNSCFVDGDAKLLSQVMINLLSNAIHYNRTNGEIFASVHADGAMNVIKVRDTGVGIAEGSLPHLFERFFRQDAARSNSRDSKLPSSQGLGLAIIKSIVAAHGGEVTVTSQVDVGTEFTVTLTAS